MYYYYFIIIIIIRDFIVHTSEAVCLGNIFSKLGFTWQAFGAFRSRARETMLSYGRCTKNLQRLKYDIVQQLVFVDNEFCKTL